jgi:hypothetical protein
VRVVKRSWVLIVACLALAAAVGGASPASAQDPNAVPPVVSLKAAGIEGLLGPGKATLAYFKTEAPDPSWDYDAESKVTFACAIDGAAIPCVGTYHGCCRTSSGKTAVPGYFAGGVPLPADLADGAHTITVTATDEDGTSAPASVVATYDVEPPQPPELTEEPPRVSHDRKPVVSYTATDDVQLLGGKRPEPFRAVLRRLTPTAYRYDENPSGSYLSARFPRCSSLLTCSDTDQAVYEAWERNFTYGVPERLVAGLYEFRVRARDAVGNVSPYTTYRFRILRGRAG